jgi:hypothetical protein
MVKQFAKEFMIEEVLWGDDKIVSDEIVDNSRWSIIHELIFSHDGHFYRTTYSVGATEQQDEGPWEYDDLVDCVEVVEKEVMVKKWVDK